MKTMCCMMFSPAGQMPGGTGSIASSLIDAVTIDRILTSRIR